MEKTTDRYYFTPQGLKALDEKMRQIKAEIYQVGQDMGEWARQTSETWHDNFGFEDGVRQQERLFNLLEEMMTLKNKAIVVKRGSKEEEKTFIGRKITAQDLGTEEVLKLEVGSYLNFETDENSEYFLISYDAPLARALIGKEPGKDIEAKIGNRLQKYKIIQVI